MSRPIIPEVEFRSRMLLNYGINLSRPMKQEELELARRVSLDTMARMKDEADDALRQLDRVRIEMHEIGRRLECLRSGPVTTETSTNTAPDAKT